MPPALAQRTRIASISEYPTATVREEQHVTLNKVDEIWRLQWTAPPKPYCEPNDGSLTCPCTGFAYGEGGDLYLVRLRGGVEIEKLGLTSLFAETSGIAVVQRWPVDYDKDFNNSKLDGFPILVSQRAATQVMHFADYDHDGNETEFYLQTDVLPCGKSLGIVIGLSKNNRRLHVFGSAPNPNKALYLQKREWEALRDASGPVEVLDWACGDHGAETETRVLLHWTRDGVAGVRREYTCPSNSATQRMIHEGPL